MCTAGCCGVSHVAAGSACSDHGGSLCNEDGRCVASHCVDGVKDLDETAVDCGGSCLGCAATQACNVNQDCASQLCSGTPGTCMECDTAQQCPATGNECTAATCTAHHCGVMNLDQTHTLSVGQTAGDCQRLACNGQGGVALVVDASDLPVSDTVCQTQPACSGTPVAPSFTPAAVGADCSQDGRLLERVCGGGAKAGSCIQCNTAPDCHNGSCTGTTFNAPACTANECVAGTPVDCAASSKVCDPQAGCVMCNVPQDCSDTGNVCVERTCENHMCGTAFADATKTVSGGMPGDCQKLVCNGTGGTKSADDATDLPVVTSVCQSNPTCAGMPLAPKFAYAAAGTSCLADNQFPNQLCGDPTNAQLAGVCVQCNTTQDCSAYFDGGFVQCTAGMCVF